MANASSEEEEQREEGGVSTALAAIFSPVLDLLDDVGGTVTLAGRTIAWLIRPPFRLAQLFAALDFIGAGSTFIVALVGILRLGWIAELRSAGTQV